MQSLVPLVDALLSGIVPDDVKLVGEDDSQDLDDFMACEAFALIEQVGHDGAMDIPEHPPLRFSFLM